MNPNLNPELYGPRINLPLIENNQNLEKLFQFAPYIAFLVIILIFFVWYLKLPPEQKENFKNSIIPSIKIGLAIIGFTIIFRATQEISKKPLVSFVIALILFSLLPVIVYLLKVPLQKLKIQKDK
jgi:predicted Na+-dependent transporter